MKFLEFSLLICACGLFAACQTNDGSYRILYVNSYHSGYPPSDAVMEALHAGLPSDSFEITTLYLDTKRQPDTSHVNARIREIKSRLKTEHFDALLVSDDAAVQYLVSPNQNSISIPVIYSGVNWSAESYQLDETKVTGILEVLPLHELLRQLQALYPGKRNLLILSEKSLSEEKNSKFLDTLYRNAGFIPTYRLVNTFEEWQEAFLHAMDSADVVYLPTNGAIQNWDKARAKDFVTEHIRVPVVTCDDFMMPYCVYGLTKVPAEHGEFLAYAVQEALKGTPVNRIGPARNTRYEVWFNRDLARQIGFPEPETEYSQP